LGAAVKKLAITIAVIASVGTPTFAADMAVKAPPPPRAQVYGWTGWYVGGNAGYGWGTADNNISFAQPGISPNPPATFGAQNFVKSHGAIGGAQVGYNWQIGRYLLGLEADIQAAGQKGTSTFNGSIFSLPTIAPNPATGTDIDKLNWFGTVRGRLGLTFDHWLVYGTGGLAYGSVELMGSVQPATAQIPHPNAPIVWNHSTVKVGWVVGGGSRTK
jgi:outer membrane immunogenic protein